MQEFVNALYDYDLSKLAEPYGPKLQRFDKLSSYMKVAIKGLSDATVSAMKVAEALYIIKTEELYLDYPIPGTNNSQTFHSGIKDFLLFCKSCFKASKSTVYNNLAIYERFGSSKDKQRFISPNIKKFTYTQLTLMLGLDDSEISNITPDWSCSEIKKYVKQVKDKKENEQFSNRLEKQEDDNSNATIRFVYSLNNDKARLELLDLYKEWDMQKDIDVLGNRLLFYSLTLSAMMTLIAVECSNAEYSDVSYYLVGECSNPWSYSVNKTLVLGNPASKNKIVTYLRDVKVSSVVLNKKF